MVADKSLFATRQPLDNGVMTRIKSPKVTLAQWLAVLAIWGLAAYGKFASKPAEPVTDQVHLIACHAP
jgi:hypothetical protein